MNHSVPDCGIRKIGGSPPIIFSTPAIGCVLDLPGLPGGGNKIYDRSPYGNHGTITGVTWERLPSGLWGLSFDGGDDYVLVPDVPSLDVAHMTVSLWIYPDDITTAAARHPLRKEEAYIVQQFEDDIYIYPYIDGGYRSCKATAVLSATTWHHIVGTFNGTSIMVYINGKRNNTTAYTGTINPSSNDLYVGAREGPTDYFKGDLALPRIWNYALSAMQARKIYDAEKHLFGVW